MMSTPRTPRRPAPRAAAAQAYARIAAVFLTFEICAGSFCRAAVSGGEFAAQPGSPMDLYAEPAFAFEPPPPFGSGGDSAAPETTVLQAEVSDLPREAPNGRSPRVSNLFFETSLREALVDISSQTGVIIVPDNSVQGLVTCELKDVPLEDALRIVLSVGGFVYRKMDGYILAGSPDPESPSFALLSESRIVPLNHILPSKAVQGLSASMRRYADASDDSKTVTVTAPTELLERIVALLQEVDRKPRQLLLDARIAVMEEGDLLNLGLQWDWPTVLAGAYTDSELHGDLAPDPRGDGWPWGVRVGYTPGKEFTNALTLTLNLLAQNNDATVLASPRVMAVDGKEAKIAVTTEEYFEILTQGFYTSSELEKIESGTLLTITPQIEEKDSIRMEMATEVSDVISRGSGNLPVVTRRTATSVVRVRDGGTAAVAGMLQNRNNRVVDRVPFLGWVPALGRLFRNDSHLASNRQVAVFVTARLAPDGGESPAAVAGVPLTGQRPAAPVAAGADFAQQLKESLRRMDGKEAGA